MPTEMYMRVDPLVARKRSISSKMERIYFIVQIRFCCLKVYMMLCHLKNLNDVTAYSPCENIYTSRSVKSNLAYEMDLLNFI
jgi:hypothetical protein